MLGSIVSAGLAWLAVAQTELVPTECDSRGPASDQTAWSATVKPKDARIHFLKSRAKDSQCPSGEAACLRKDYLVPDDNVLAWSRWGDTFCAMYTARNGTVTVGRLWGEALDFHGAGSAPRASDWVGHWRRDDEADIHIRRLDDTHLEIEGDASWGGHDPERVGNGGVNVGEIEPTQLRLTGHVLHLIAGRGNAPPVADAEHECTVDLQLQAGTLLAKDNRECGGMNVSFSGTYQRVAP
jgi:hypothetical protein